MYCNKCGNKLEQNQQYCNRCGSRIFYNAQNNINEVIYNSTQYDINDNVVNNNIILTIIIWNLKMKIHYFNSFFWGGEKL